LYRNLYPGGLATSEKKDLGNRLGTTYIGGEEKTYKRGYTMDEYAPWMRKKHPST